MISKKYKIMVVDDDKDVLYAVKRGLESVRKEYEIVLANGGKECLSLVRQNPPDLILLDLMMPDIDGWVVYAKIKTNKNTKNIPIIFLTALGDNEGYIVKLFDKLVKGSKDMKKLACVEITKDTYIQKPFDVKEMDKKIRKLLKKVD